MSTGAQAPEPRPDIVIRPSTEQDVPAMLDIYTHHIQRGMGDLVVEPADPDDIKKRRKNMLRKRLPHLAAECDGRIVGYAYAVPFRKRPAYRYTVKHSIYIHPDFVGVGIGRRLLKALVESCAASGFRQMIGYIDAANAASIRLHEAAGFREVGRLPAVGFKFGHWTDSILMQCPLGPGSDSVPAPLTRKD
ncbi:GNAT family N-acetyltransferase [Ferrovibrio xuzhouensis]|uniref:GNAT family N-acetyltransferase n=1 Tax=Ferrovibrio xuzhouensis TaxID=1576914 RepID=A0ABV7VLA2_9PROT